MVDNKFQLIQLGTTQEQAVLLKTNECYGGFFIKANLINSFPGAVFSFLQRSKKMFYIDPITYIFTLIPSNKEDDKPKDAICNLAQKYLYKFYDNLNKGMKTEISALKEKDLEVLASNVLQFQNECFSNVLKEDIFNKILTEFINKDIIPKKTIAPYFLNCEDGSQALSEFNIDINTRLISISREVDKDVAGIITLTLEMLSDIDCVNTITKKYFATRINTFIIWINNFEEISVSEKVLRNLIYFIKKFNDNNKIIINLYGGYLSALLTKVGLDGFSHGPGYSEMRGFEPVTGMTPSPKYYFLPFHQRYLMDILFDTFKGMEGDEFKREICNCLICERLIDSRKNNESIISKMHLFAEVDKRIVRKVRNRSGELSKRVYTVYFNRSQQIAKYHYIINKHKEMQQVNNNSLKNIKKVLEEDSGKFRINEKIRNPIPKWIDIVSIIEECSKIRK